MINITKLTQEDIGRWVIYLPFYGGGEPEKGRIKAWNDRNIFVVYKCNNEWNRFQDFAGCSTDPKDLEFIIKG